jgi:dsDNA-specific endonuclease/ATPase MutS2
VCADNLNETLTDTVEGTVKLLDDREEALDEMTHSINEYEAIHEKIVSKNSELRNAVRHLKKENEALTEENTQLKKQLEMMKEVDLKTDRK